MDTNLLVAEWRRRADVVRSMRELQRRGVCYVSALTRMEMFAGARPQLVVDTRQFLHRFAAIEVTNAIADVAGRFGWAHRRTHRGNTTDLVIAATAALHRLELVTLNPDDFPMREVKLYPLADELRQTPRNRQ